MVFTALMVTLTFVGLAIGIASASGPTYVSGPITSDTTWTLANSPYIVIGGVLVNNGVTLTIEPGVTVKFDSGFALQIDGTLIARGTSDNTITFTSNQTTPAAGDWGYILFSDSSTDATYDGNGDYTGGCILEYCIVEYAGASSNAAIKAKSSSPFLSNGIIKNNSGDGIHADNAVETMQICNCTINNNGGNGISGGEGVYGTGAGFKITHCTIEDNEGTGIFIYSNQLVTIDSCSIERNLGGGISVSGREGNFVISKCVVNNNSETGIGVGGRVDSWANVNIYNCTVSNNVAYRGAGIQLGFVTGTIDNCNISHNTANAYFGGIWIAGGSISISNSTISHNSALGQGGWTGNAGGIHIDEGGPGAASVRISNCKIHDNSATGNGGGIATSLYYGGSVRLTIEGSQIMNNVAGDVGGGIYAKGTIDISNSSIMHNSAFDYPALYVTQSEGSIYHNTLISNYNLPSNPAPSSAVYINGNPNFNYNNIHSNNATYKLYNGNSQGSPNLNATNNWWGTTDEAEIQVMIYDWFDDSSLGIVDYSPYLFTPDTTAPISPPTGLTATAGDSAINLSWSANPETDLAGYKVYYDTDSGYPYTGTGANEGSSEIDVGDVTSYQLSGLTNGVKYYVAITAYDTTGDESWYSNEVSATPHIIIPPPTVSIETDKFEYSPSDTMTITIDITNPTEDSVMFQWYWGVPQYSIWRSVKSAPIPPGYDDTHDFSFTIPNWGSTSFGNVFYVQLLDGSGEVLDADVTWWAYSPGGKAMPAAEVDIAKEIKKTIKMLE